ncbi:MAG TPA: polyribonucleotide nucleotidyltransferase [Clostridia bacterium]|jgi:polyribonucleotide nucleotidyltransferase|nr:polyribonucleotide nucleotidyltransferase [Clostridiaceae bacterium]HOF26407.1 polyribonucleotide nucleotidyltransferase [Clostridia bacterium]HOM34186.1 polyribonucleotide nucleotidyltransferase [Clostridia bacterium]HOR89766.1 polyribonucleotide nucleotidyltransferase [Clostridia bacterium]HPL07994.1 polyribonucleotide nucleotidyltransferase [Clostridia bacterium]
MHENHKKHVINYAGKEVVIETGKHAQLANGSCLVRYGDTVVLATITASKEPRPGIDFFPLSIDYEEKMYSVGKIPGSRNRREGRPSDAAILVSRVIDRPMRPLFPHDLRNDVVIICTALSVEQDNQPQLAAMLGASIATSISDIPFDGPVASVALGLVDGKVVLNPDAAQRAVSDMYVTVAGTKEKICMIEAEAKQVPDDVMFNALLIGHEEIKSVCAQIEKIAAEIGKEKFTYESAAVPKEVYAEVEDIALDEMKQAVLSADKTVREAKVDQLTAMVNEQLGEKYADNPGYIADALYNLEKKVVRNYLLNEKKRVDGRALDEIRPLFSEVGVLPRTHGSAMFQRGQTQVLSSVTLGGLRDVLPLEILDEAETEDRYMHHYNFPSYSVGEAKTSRGPGRREIGHGALAQKALLGVIPSEEEFPYAIRVVSDVLMSNGSTSQGSVCGSTLALMDAGVPIIAPVAGISCGLVTDADNPSNYEMMIDIQGIEDFFGDMDFKVAGTHKGITAIQVDIKIDGLTPEIIKRAFEITRKGRLYILDEVMLKVIDKPRPELSPYAPKIITMTIDPEKIKDVIGTGGKIINRIIDMTGVKIDINDDGTVYILTVDQQSGDKAVSIINGIVNDLEPGMIFNDAVVTRIMDFGAFVELVPGKEGLVHISQIARERINKVSDVLSVGDKVNVKVVEIDRQGRVNLSRKALLPR